MNKKSIAKKIAENKNIMTTVVGGVTSYLLNDPTGLSGEMVKGGIDSLLTKLVEDLDKRKLSESEKQRVIDVFEYAINDIVEKLDEGKVIRDDGFFSRNVDDESDAEEIFEGIIIGAQREYENKKLKYYGKLLSNISFCTEVSKENVIQLMNLANKLTYRQYILLAIIYTSHQIDNRIHFLTNKMLKDQNKTFEQIAIYQDIFELYRIGLINGNGSVILELGYIAPSELRIQGVGVKLYEYMELWDIALNNNEYISVLKELKHEQCSITNNGVAVK